METVQRNKNLSSRIGSSLLDGIDSLGDHFLKSFSKAYEKAKIPTAYALSFLTLGTSVPALSPIVFARKVEDTSSIQSGSDILAQNQQTLEDLLQVSNPDFQQGDPTSTQIYSPTQTTTTTEQVKEVKPWTLTDSYGNTDIMDNDNIVVHLPSDITSDLIKEVEWYRNGIQMRFINPLDKDLELTNSEMKTFDGNPAEHSPASSTTDHAIQGYEISSKVYLEDGTVKILETTIESTFKWHPKEVWAELQSNWMGELGEIQYNQLVDYFKILKMDGFTGISLDMCYYMDSPLDNEVKILPNVDASIISWYGFTPSNNDLETILKAINEAGLDSHVRGPILINLKYQNEHGFSWSSEIEPRNPTLFFKSYTKLWMRIIPILNKYNVKLITPFVEMDGIEKYSSQIKEMYSKLSKVFSGEFGFDESTHHMLQGHSPVQNGRTFKQMERNFTFWDWVDSKGRPMRIEYNSWDFKMETQKDQRVSVIGQMFKQFWSQAVSYYSSTYPNNSQMFGEIGARDADGYVLGPDYYYSLTNRISDEQERADLIFAVLKTSEELGIYRLNICQFLLCDLAPNWKNGVGMNIGYATLPPSPEYRIIKAIIEPETPSLKE